jgi:hypothetical protein
VEKTIYSAPVQNKKLKAKQGLSAAQRMVCIKNELGHGLVNLTN